VVTNVVVKVVVVVVVVDYQELGTEQLFNPCFLLFLLLILPPSRQWVSSH